MSKPDDGTYQNWTFEALDHMNKRHLHDLMRAYKQFIPSLKLSKDYPLQRDANLNYSAIGSPGAMCVDTIKGG